MHDRNIEIDQDRLRFVMQQPLLEGNHKAPNGDFQACVMEAAAYIANEPWSDAPECVCPVIREFMVSWNDVLPNDDDRDRLLKPLLTKVVGTRATKAAEKKRSYMALDWLIRVHTPKWLELTESLKPHANALRDLNEITDLAGATAAGTLTAAARDAAWDAAGDAAWAAARDAARAAARDAAWAAAWDAARAAARDAAWDAAGDAAWDAARAAARDALKPTTEWLQTSASDLVIRMCEVTE